METNSNKDLLSTLGITTAIAVIVLIGFELAERYHSILASFNTHDLDGPEYWQYFIVLVLAAGAGVATKLVGVKRALPILGLLTLLLFVGNIIFVWFLSIKEFFVQSFVVATLTVAAVQLRELWKIDTQLTDKLRKLVSTDHLQDGRTAESRIETGLKVLETIFPLSDAIVFLYDPDEGSIKPAGSARNRKRPSPPADVQLRWKENHALCEEAVSTRATCVDIDPQEDGGARIALPLIYEKILVGVLFVSIKRNFEMADRNLLEAFSEQLARNLQRSILNKKEMPHHTWKGFLSAQSARNRADTVTLLDNMMREQTYTTVASSYLKEAHAIAYLDGSIAYLNRKMRHLAKIDHSELSQLTLLDLLEHFKTDIFGEPRLAVRKVLQSGESYTCELDFPDEKLTLDLQISLVKVPEREQSIHETSAPMKPACLLITLRDISAVKENAKLRSDMASLMSHELRTPITSIKGFAELLLMDDSMNPESREFLAIIDNEAERLSKMLTTFLSVSNLEQSDKQEFVKTPVRLDHVVKRVVEEMGESAKQKRIRLVEQSRADIPPVAADKGMIAKVVQNLIDNAIKYSPEKTAVIISTILEAEFLRVTVEDRGYGIAPSEQQKIFEKFYRISRDGMDKEAESTGLGLSFVKEAVEQHGGSVEVESEPQQGSKFSFTIPRL